jgi:predicted PurR-regulated permease PerM
MTDAPERSEAQIVEAEAATSASAEKPAVRLTSQSVPRWAVVGIFILLLIVGLAYARNFLVPVVLSFLLALVFSPMRRFLERWGLPSGLSALLIVGTLLVVLVTGVLMVAGPVKGWVDNAPEIGRQLEERLRTLRGSAEAVMEAGKQVNEIASAAQDKNAPEVVVQQPDFLSGFVFSTPAALAQMMLTLLLLFFLLASGDMFYEKIVHVLPTFKDKRRAMRIACDIERKLSRYLFTITIINAGLGVAIGMAMWLLGIPNPVLFGTMGFAFNYVPYLGPLIGVALTAIVGLITFDEIGLALISTATYFALTSLEGQLITPYFVGRRLEMNTVVIFLSVALWAWLWSVIGMLIAVPLLVAIRAFCEHIPQLEPLGDFLSARGIESANEEDAAAGS